MKKSLILIPFIIFSCNKKEKVSEYSYASDSLKIKDSLINNSPKLKEVLREIDGNKIIRIFDVAEFPLTIDEEFTNENQAFILKIKNFSNKKISGKIIPENPEMNIRFNQIKLPNGDFDGPFGREISYDIKEKGEIWLIIGKSNMASGDVTGKFTVSLE